MSDLRIEQDQIIEISKKCVRSKKKYVDNTSLKCLKINLQLIN